METSTHSAVDWGCGDQMHRLFGNPQIFNSDQSEPIESIKLNFPPNLTPSLLAGKYYKLCKKEGAHAKMTNFGRFEILS